MKVIQRNLELSKIDYYRTHLKIINAIIPVNITDKEIEILSEFLSLPEEIIKDDMFNTLARKTAAKNLNINSSGLANHIKNMKAKGFLKKENVLMVIPALLPDENKQGYNFKMIMKND